MNQKEVKEGLVVQVDNKMRKTNLCFLIRGDEILLAMKKRGFGIGRWNGVGGKVKEGESVEDAAIREINEEIGVEVKKEDMETVAKLEFIFVNKPEWNQEVCVYFISKWIGEPTESEEMKPQWYMKTDLPFDKMWEDDPNWLPRVIKGERVKGYFSFDENQKMLPGFRVDKLTL